jgi:hypothetical protein
MIGVAAMSFRTRGTRDPESRGKCTRLWIPAFAGMTIPDAASPSSVIAAELRHNLRAASAFAISFRTPYLWNGMMKKR